MTMDQKNPSGSAVVAFTLAVGLLASLGACTRAQTPEAEDHEDAFAHSPWWVSVSGDLPFRSVTFKDVGMSRTLPGPTDPLLETIASSLAMTLAADSALGVRETVVDYNASLLDPSAHVFCGHSHLYVDLWRGDAPARWGYSLWSGCSEDDQFAWHEVMTPALPETDAVEAVEALTASIAGSLREAASRGCYQRAC